MNKRMNIKNSYGWLALLVLPLCMLASCTEEQIDSMEKDVTETETIALFSSSTEAGDAAELEIDRVFTAQESLGPFPNSRMLEPVDPCVSITRDAESRTLTFDFGTEGCRGPDGRIRRGKMIVTFSGRISDRKSDRVIRFERYFVNRVQYLGEIGIRGFRESTEGILTSVRVLRDFTMVSPDGNRMVTNGEMTREWLEGVGNGDPSTNRVRLTGFKTGRSSTGRAFRELIIEPVILDFGCLAAGGMLRVAGVVEMTVGIPAAANASRTTRRIDYGDGSCDKQVTVNIDGRERTLAFGER